MSIKPGRPPDDASSAPESGTVRDETSGNQPSHPHERGEASHRHGKNGQCEPNDDPSYAGEER
jgi:hypothetical protein